MFINSVTHAITGDGAMQVDLDATFRGLSIEIEDSEPVYP